MPTINLKGVSLGFEPIPEGWYSATLSEWKFVAKSQSSGQPYLGLTFTVDEPEEHAGRKLFLNRSVQKQSLWSLKATLVALGVDPDALEAEIDLDDLMPNVLGNAVKIYADIGTNPKNGEPNNGVKYVKASDYDIYADEA